MSVCAGVWTLFRLPHADGKDMHIVAHQLGLMSDYICLF